MNLLDFNNKPFAFIAGTGQIADHVTAIFQGRGVFVLVIGQLRDLLSLAFEQLIQKIDQHILIRLLSENPFEAAVRQRVNVETKVYLPFPFFSRC